DRRTARLIAGGLRWQTLRRQGIHSKASIHLLDSATGQTVHSWQFEQCSMIRIGRSPENHIVISDPKVSRFHAELRFDGASWQVVNLGANGLVVAGNSVSQSPIHDQMKFRLGSGGPVFRFEHLAEKSNWPDKTVLASSLMSVPAIKIDEAQKESQV